MVDKELSIIIKPITVPTIPSFNSMSATKNPLSTISYSLDFNCSWKDLLFEIFDREGEEVGDATDLFMSNKIKEIEATKLLYKYDGKGMVKGVKTGDASDVIGGVLNSVSSMVETMGPAVLTRGASLFPQITSPMYYEYNKIFVSKEEE